MRKLFGYSCFILLLAVIGCRLSSPPPSQPARLGYFEGGRCFLIQRTYFNGYFEKEGVKVEFYTKSPNETSITFVPPNYEIFKQLQQQTSDRFGRMTGLEIIDEMSKGNLEGGAVGETSFIRTVAQSDNTRSPFVAVATLGVTRADIPGHALFLRKGVRINNPSDFKGKRLGTRFSGGGDTLFLKELLMQLGVNLDEVTILENLMPEEEHRLLINGEIDGGIYHYLAGKKLVEDGSAYVWRVLDWVNPEISLALLIFRADFVKRQPDTVKKILRAYQKRINYERDLGCPEPDSRGVCSISRPGKNEFGPPLKIVSPEMGMATPYNLDYPRVDIKLLNEMQSLMVKHGMIKQPVDLSSYIDNGFIDDVYRELKKE